MGLSPPVACHQLGDCQRPQIARVKRLGFVGEAQISQRTVIFVVCRKLRNLALWARVEVVKKLLSLLSTMSQGNWLCGRESKQSRDYHHRCSSRAKGLSFHGKGSSNQGIFIAIIFHDLSDSVSQVRVQAVKGFSSPLFVVSQGTQLCERGSKQSRECHCRCSLRVEELSFHG